MSRQKIYLFANEPFQALLQHKATNGETFTVCELRDHLSKYPNLCGFDPIQLRLYVRDQINKRVKQGSVEQVGTLGKRRAVYQLTSSFKADLDETSHDPACDAHAEPLDEKLGRDSDQLRAQMEASDHRLQALQDIAAKYPDAHEAIAPLFDQEKTRAKSLGEKLKVYAEVRQQLERLGGEA